LDGRNLSAFIADVKSMVANMPSVAGGCMSVLRSWRNRNIQPTRQRQTLVTLC
jgi:hypothetical protein